MLNLRVYNCSSQQHNVVLRPKETMYTEMDNISFSSVGLRSGKLAQLLICLPRKPSGLSFIPQNPHLKSIVVHVHLQSQPHRDRHRLIPGVQQPNNPLHLMSSRSVKDPVSKENQIESEEWHLSWCLAFTCSHIHAHSQHTCAPAHTQACTHMNIHA